MATGTAFSDDMEQDILLRYLKNTTTQITSTPAASVYVGLGTAGADTGLTEPAAGNGYTRQAFVFGTPSGGTITGPTAAVTFGQCTGSNWGTITHFGIFDATSTTTFKMLFWGALGSSVAINVNDRFEFAASAVTITVD
jgi:hypothetical protein